MPPKPPPGLGFEIVIHMPDGESGESVDDLIEPHSRLVAGASAKERPRLAEAVPMRFRLLAGAGPFACVLRLVGAELHRESGKIDSEAGAIVRVQTRMSSSRPLGGGSV